jgi:hypothetical protein
MKTFKLVLYVFAFCSVFHMRALGQVFSTNFLPENYEIRTAEAAVAMALQYTGFHKGKTFSLKKAEDMARLVTVDDSTSPFFPDKFTGQAVWSVWFDSIAVDYEARLPEPAREQVRDFEVLIDPGTGQLLKVTSLENYDHGVFTSGAWADVWENQINYEVTIGTSDPPPVPLYEALKKVSHVSQPKGEKSIDPKLAKAIIAYCLSYTWAEKPPIPSFTLSHPDSVRSMIVWYIIMKDYQVQDHSDSLGTVPGVLSRRLDCNVIDGTSGQLITTATVRDRPSGPKRRQWRH